MAGALDALARGARSILGRALSGREMGAFEKYLQLLKKWQRIHRLVGSVEPGWVVENLFLDSLVFLQALPEEVHYLGDLGSGAGFPGVPIKIVRPELEVILIESRQRRASFLSTLVRELGLERCRVIAARAETLAGDLVPLLDALVMRCAGSLADAMPVAKTLIRPGGAVVASAPPGPRIENLPGVEWLEVRSHVPGVTRRLARSLRL